jgi:hypothetical protein
MDGGGIGDTQLESYIKYLQETNYPKVLIPVRNPEMDEKYTGFIRKKQSQGKSLDEIFIDCIRSNNIIMFKKMLQDVRVDPACNKNEPVIFCVLNNKHSMLNMLLKDPRVSPYDQNNLAIRFAISQKNKSMIQLLLSHQGVVDSIYCDPELLSCIWIFQNNGGVIF